MAPISKKRRNIYFFTLLIIFIVTIPFIVLYSFGYDVNDARALIQTGGVNVDTNMSGVVLFVDDEYAEQSSFISRDIFVQKLKLGEHNVATTKAGYYPWYKTVEIYPNRVTTLQALMLPIEIPFQKYEEPSTVGSVDSLGGTEIRPIVSNVYSDLSEWFFSTSTPSETFNNVMKYSNEVLDKDVIVATTSPQNNVTFNRLQISPTSTEVIFSDQDIIEYFVNNGYSTSTIAGIEFIKNGDMLIWQNEKTMHVVWLGKIESIPPFFCVDIDCDFEKEIVRDDVIERFSFMPNYPGMLLIETKDGVFVTEIDDRGGINTQPVFDRAGATYKITDSDDVVIYYDDVFYVWEV